MGTEQIRTLIQSHTNTPWRFTRSDPSTRAFLIGLSISALLTIGGCGEADLPPGITKKAVTMEEVPDALRTAARKAIPNVEFKEAWQNLDAQGKLHSFEIRGRQGSDGKIREVRVSLTGQILESE